MRRIILAAAAALFLAPSGARAATALCQTGGAPLSLPAPRTGDVGTVPFDCVRRAILQVSTSAVASSTGTSFIAGSLAVGRMTGTTVSGGITIASATTQTSSATFTASGNTQYSIETSSGIKVVAGGVVAPFFVGSGSGLTGVTAAPSGAAGGDLAGTYPNPTVARVQAGGVDLSTVTTALAGKQATDTDLDDLADGSLTASKVGAGYPVTSLTAGLLPDGTRILPAGVDLSTVTTALAAKQAADTDLDDLSDGSLTASKVGSGYPVTSLSAGLLPDGTRILPSGVDLSTVTTALTAKQAADTDLDDLADGSLTASKVAAGYDASGLTGRVPSVSVDLSTVTTALSGKQDADANLAALAGGVVTVSSLTTTATGAAQYSIQASSGIRMDNGTLLMGTNSQIKWADGTISTTASSGNAGSTVFISTFGRILNDTAGTTGLALATCVANSTRTVTVGRSFIDVIFSGSAQAASNSYAVGFLVNGAYPTGMSISYGAVSRYESDASASSNMSFTYPRIPVTPGTVSVCLTAAAASGVTLCDSDFSFGTVCRFGFRESD